MDIYKYKTVSEMYNALRKKGVRVPLQMCRAIEGEMKRKNLSFPEAFKKLVDNKVVILLDTFLLTDHMKLLEN
ncbi:MAG TPA: hypothetical protein VMR41_02490 [Patescibacteria group bacterium]|nr:hypothetical protein [Patescibacteria group bacterium]